jgi:glycosyltransferase involved in cell wall biosynthesis
MSSRSLFRTDTHAPGRFAAATSSSIAAPDAPRVDVSVVLPCLNEEATVAAVVAEAFEGLEAAAVSGEVIVVDNGSTDRSAELARAAGAIVVDEPRRGYGSAYLAGIDAARGETLVLADADGTYPLRDLDRLLAEIRAGADLVLGSRFKGRLQRGAMPWANRWIGNPVLTGMLNVFFRTGVSDAHSGMRAVRRAALPVLGLRTTGMEFASEMVVKASKARLDVREVPIDYRLRAGTSKLSPVRDGWRHVRFLLVESPTWLFLVPGAALFLAGAVVLAALAPGPTDVFGRRWEIHTAIFAAILTLVGSQIVQLGLFARTYAVLYLGERDALLERGWRRVRLEHGLLAGALVLVAGLVVLGFVVGRWIVHGFGDLHEEHLSIAGLTLVGLGVQTIFGSFFLSVLSLRPRSDPPH